MFDIIIIIINLEKMTIRNTERKELEAEHLGEDGPRPERASAPRSVVARVLQGGKEGASEAGTCCAGHTAR